MAIGLFSRCLGCNATMFAMSNHPRKFENVRCMVGTQPVSVGVVLERVLTLADIPADRINDVEHRMRLHTSFTLEDMSPANAAKSLTIPTFLYQVRDDVLTRPSDVQTIYDNIPIGEKKLSWIEGSTRRWDGYSYFAKDPIQFLDWFGTYMS